MESIEVGKARADRRRPATPRAATKEVGGKRDDVLEPRK